MNKEDFAYTAGIIDGEGSISISKTHSLQVSVAMTNDYVPLWLNFGFGGSIYTRKGQSAKWKDQTQWTLSGKKAGVFLKLILPYLKIKRPQAELALKFISLKVPANGNRYSEAEKYLREIQRLDMGKMNKRGTDLPPADQVNPEP